MSEYPLYNAWAARLQWNQAPGLVMFCVMVVVLVLRLHDWRPALLKWFVLGASALFSLILIIATFIASSSDANIQSIGIPIFLSLSFAALIGVNWGDDEDQ